MTREVWVADDAPADKPEQFEWVHYSAQEFPNVGDLYRKYETRGWATPISGDRTTIMRKFK